MSSPTFDTSGSVTGPPATFRHRHHRRHSHAHGHGRSLSTRIKYQVRHYLNRYHSASKQGKAIFWGLVLFHVVLIGAIAIITPRRIGLFFTHVAEGLRELGPGGIGGMAILFLCVGELYTKPDLLISMSLDSDCGRADSLPAFAVALGRPQSSPPTRHSSALQDP